MYLREVIQHVWAYLDASKIMFTASMVDFAELRMHLRMNIFTLKYLKRV